MYGEIPQSQLESRGKFSARQLPLFHSSGLGGLWPGGSDGGRLLLGAIVV